MFSFCFKAITTCFVSLIYLYVFLYVFTFCLFPSATVPIAMRLLGVLDVLAFQPDMCPRLSHARVASSVQDSHMLVLLVVGQLPLLLSCGMNQAMSAAFGWCKAAGTETREKTAITLPVPPQQKSTLHDLNELNDVRIITETLGTLVNTMVAAFKKNRITTQNDCMYTQG